MFDAEKTTGRSYTASRNSSDSSDEYARPMDVLCIGEAMVELRGAGDGFDAAVAGDAFNTAVWLARSARADVTLAQDLGDDVLHGRLTTAFAARGVRWHGRRHVGATNGMYLVDVDGAGE